MSHNLDDSERQLRAAAALFFKHEAQRMEGLLTDAELMADWEEHHLNALRDSVAPRKRLRDRLKSVVSGRERQTP